MSAFQRTPASPPPFCSATAARPSISSRTSRSASTRSVAMPQPKVLALPRPVARSVDVAAVLSEEIAHGCVPRRVLETSTAAFLPPRLLSLAGWGPGRANGLLRDVTATMAEFGEMAEAGPVKVAGALSLKLVMPWDLPVIQQACGGAGVASLSLALAPKFAAPELVTPTTLAAGYRRPEFSARTGSVPKALLSLPGNAAALGRIPGLTTVCLTSSDGKGNVAAAAARTDVVARLITALPPTVTSLSVAGGGRPLSGSVWASVPQLRELRLDGRLGDSWPAALEHCPHLRTFRVKVYGDSFDTSALERLPPMLGDVAVDYYHVADEQRLEAVLAALWTLLHLKRLSLTTTKTRSVSCAPYKTKLRPVDAAERLSGAMVPDTVLDLTTAPWSGMTEVVLPFVSASSSLGIERYAATLERLELSVPCGDAALPLLREWPLTFAALHTLSLRLTGDGMGCAAVRALEGLPRLSDLTLQNFTATTLVAVACFLPALSRLHLRCPLGLALPTGDACAVARAGRILLSDGHGDKETVSARSETMSDVSDSSVERTPDTFCADTGLSPEYFLGAAAQLDGPSIILDALGPHAMLHPVRSLHTVSVDVAITLDEVDAFRVLWPVARVFAVGREVRLKDALPAAPTRDAMSQSVDSVAKQLLPFRSPVV